MWFGVNTSLFLLIGGSLNRARARLGLAPISLMRMGEYSLANSHTILAMNAHLSPPSPSWSGRYTYVGYPFNQDEGPISREIEAFLAAGPPPVFIGLGSCSVPDGERFTRTVVEAVGSSGCRAILSRGWARLPFATASEDMLVVDETPHATLFPRVAAVVHHGGSGTTHNAARAGVPQLALPQLVDQFHWGHRVHQLGLGPKAIAPARLTVPRLAEALRMLVGDQLLAARARHFGTWMAGEDGAARTVDLVTGELEMNLKLKSSVGRINGSAQDHPSSTRDQHGLHRRPAARAT